MTNAQVAQDVRHGYRPEQFAAAAGAYGESVMAALLEDGDVADIVLVAHCAFHLGGRVLDQDRRPA